MADVWANSMACHPRATYHTSGCCHLANSMSWFQSHVSHYRVLPLGEFTVTLQGAVIWGNQCHERAPLHGIRIPSAILKIVFRHILFFLFLIQFRLWRAAAFVSSPIHLLQSDCSDLVSKLRGHTVATTFLLRSHCQTFAGCLQTIMLCFNRTAPGLIEHATPLLSCRETRETRCRL